MEKYLEKYLTRYPLKKGLKLLKKGYPPQYIVGHTDFYGYKIYINKHTLIPRFETEELVEKLIKRINNKFSEKVSLLDLCTGSGCIGIALSKELNREVDISDISKKALKIANKNIKYNQATINIIKSDLFKNIKKKYNIIVSNPPYISEKEDIMAIVKKNEPHKALYAPNKGLYFYEKIIKNIKDHLEEDFIIGFEIGSTQAEEIIKLVEDHLEGIKVTCEKDLQNRNRFIFIESN